MTSSSPAVPRDINAADVYLDDRIIAGLTRTSLDEIVFEYTAEPVSSTESLRDRSVSWSLLANLKHPVVTTGGSVPPFFAGLLPEGVRLGVVISSTKTSPDDHLTLLLAIGAETTGNIRVVPAGSGLPDRSPMFSPDRDKDFRAVFERLVGSVEADPVGLAGVQPKVSAAMWSTPTNTRIGPAILKLGPPIGFPRLVENEFFFMNLAIDCGLRVPRIQLLHDATGQSALLVSRFDREDGKRIPQEDACQVAGLYPASKYRMKAETAISRLADACAHGGGSRAATILELLRIVVYSWLIGNGDLHAKNLSIHAPESTWQATPAYDLLSTQPYAAWRDPMAMSLYGRANRLTRNDFLDAGERLGLRKRAVSNMIDDIVEGAAQAPESSDEIGFPDRQTELLADLLRSRIETLK